MRIYTDCQVTRQPARHVIRSSSTIAAKAGILVVEQRGTHGAGDCSKLFARLFVVCLGACDWLAWLSRRGRDTRDPASTERYKRNVPSGV